MPSFKKLKAELFISVSFRILLLAFGVWYKLNSQHSCTYTTSKKDFIRANQRGNRSDRCLHVREMGSECITTRNQCSEQKPISEGELRERVKKDDNFVNGRNGGNGGNGENRFHQIRMLNRINSIINLIIFLLLHNI